MTTFGSFFNKLFGGGFLTRGNWSSRFVSVSSLRVGCTIRARHVSPDSIDLVQVRSRICDSAPPSTDHDPRSTSCISRTEDSRIRAKKGKIYHSYTSHAQNSTTRRLPCPQTQTSNPTSSFTHSYITGVCGEVEDVVATRSDDKDVASARLGELENRNPTAGHASMEELKMSPSTHPDSRTQSVLPFLERNGGVRDGDRGVCGAGSFLGAVGPFGRGVPRWGCRG